MHEDPWYFWPSHTIIMFSNHKPNVQGQDVGIWRRLRLVPWPVVIPEADRDENLADKLIDEAPGILAWIVRGARTFLESGFDAPDTVRAATSEYRKDEDVVAQFIDDCLTVTGDPGDWCWAKDLTEDYEAWAHDLGKKELPAWRAVADRLKQLGCTSDKKRSAGRQGRRWLGMTRPSL
jgi:putative DNA primase/helicase